MLGLKAAAEHVGWRAVGMRVSFDRLVQEMNGTHPYAVLHLGIEHHFVAVLGQKSGAVLVVDPRAGPAYWTNRDLQHRGWEGHVLFLARR